IIHFITLLKKITDPYEFKSNFLELQMNPDSRRPLFIEIDKRWRRTRLPPIAKHFRYKLIFEDYNRFVKKCLVMEIPSESTLSIYNTSYAKTFKPTIMANEIQTAN
ncbi:hypothetical protein L9F63_008618, partial [Diploptera punctata]